MSLRPRYSLLTLLLLTALIAGGVKLWRGPHRVTLDALAEPADHYRNYEFLQLLRMNNDKEQLSDELCYDELRRIGDESEIIGITYRFKRPVYLISGRHGSEQRGQIVLRSELPPTAVEIQTGVKKIYDQMEFTPERVERLLFWVCAYVPPNSGMVAIDSPKNQQGESVCLLQMPVAYYVTSAGRIYRLREPAGFPQFGFESPFRVLRLSKVEPAELQQRLQAELDRYVLDSP